MYDAWQITNAVNGQPYFSNQTLLKTQIENISIDSRGLLISKNVLFIALKGEHRDGHNYIAELYKKGIRFFMVSTELDYSIYPKGLFIKVDHTGVALQKLGAFHRSQFSIPIIGITGSNGKTIVKEWVSFLLEKEVSICKSPRSYNSQIGVPLSVWRLNEGSQLGFFEAGISHPYQMEHLNNIIQPTIGLITNLGDAHQEGFVNSTQKLLEKIKLFAGCNTVIYRHRGNDIVSDHFERNRIKWVEYLTWGEHHLSDLQILNTQEGSDKVTISVRVNNSTLVPFFEDQEFTFDSKLVDQASIENVLHSILLVAHLSRLNLGLFPKWGEVKKRILELYPISLRLEIIQGRLDNIILNDSYSNDIQSLEIAINKLNSLSGGRKKVVILSDITHSGKEDWLIEQTVARLLKTGDIDLFIGIGSNFYVTQEIFPCPTHFYKSTSDFIQRIAEVPLCNVAILIKGGRDFEFEQLLPYYSKQSHLTTMEVNLTTARDNLNHFRNLLPPQTPIMVLLKANAYGMGILEMAYFLAQQGVDYIGVAFADEGVFLRKNGIELPIVVLNPEPATFYQMISYRLEAEIYSFKMLNEIVQTARQCGIEHYPIHLKIDTGMHRLGFLPCEIKDLEKCLLSNEHILSIRSIFSHLSSADCGELDDITKNQLTLFESIYNRLKGSVAPKSFAHILNSAGIERFPSHGGQMVRLGIGFYGYSATHNPLIQGICSLKSTIVQIKHLKKGDGVGYGQTEILSKDSPIGIIPIGYADGLNRLWGNRRGTFKINGVRVPVIGNVCMDLCMVDLSEVVAKEGDSVLIWQGNEVVDIAKRLNTIPYEVLTSISPRVKRIYYTE